MEATNKPSAAAELTNPGELVELPIAQGSNGAPFYMRLVAPPIEGILAVRRAVPPAQLPEKDAELSAEEEIDLTEQAIARLEREMKELMENGAATDPPISFEPRAGAVLWSSLHLLNRTYIRNRLARIAGLGPSKADRMGSFRPVDGGGGVRPPGDGDLPAPADAPSGAPEGVGAL